MCNVYTSICKTLIWFGTLHSSIVAGGIINNSVAPVRRSAERGPYRVPDEPRTLPADTLSPGGLRARRFRRQGTQLGK